ncbi:hypothetical protein BJX99DRAFT_225495 [Aspergillus californicus]
MRTMTTRWLLYHTPRLMPLQGLLVVIVTLRGLPLSLTHLLLPSQRLRPLLLPLWQARRPRERPSPRHQQRPRPLRRHLKRHSQLVSLIHFLYHLRLILQTQVEQNQARTRRLWILQAQPRPQLQRGDLLSQQQLQPH